METKFTSLGHLGNKGFKKTKFNYSLKYGEGVYGKTEVLPVDYGNVNYIGYDSRYGDVFMCWDDGEDGFTLFFGEKGGEFNQ